MTLCSRRLTCPPKSAPRPERKSGFPDGPQSVGTVNSSAGTEGEAPRCRAVIAVAHPQGVAGGPAAAGLTLSEVPLTGLSLSITARPKALETRAG